MCWLFVPLTRSSVPPSDPQTPHLFSHLFSCSWSNQLMVVWSQTEAVTQFQMFKKSLWCPVWLEIEVLAYRANSDAYIHAVSITYPVSLRAVFLKLLAGEWCWATGLFIPVDGWMDGWGGFHSASTTSCVEPTTASNVFMQLGLALSWARLDSTDLGLAS